jgi:hypothetical protein
MLVLVLGPHNENNNHIKWISNLNVMDLFANPDVTKHSIHQTAILLAYQTQYSSEIGL